MSYFAGRAAPMGAVGAGVVTATFYNFSPDLVAAAIPRAWQLAAPAARHRGPVRRRRRRAAAPARPGAHRLARPGHAGRPGPRGRGRVRRPRAARCTPATPTCPGRTAARTWTCGTRLSLLREHRGDGHVAALAAAGLSGLEALVTHTATGQGFTAGVRPGQPGLEPAADWDAAVAGLTARRTAGLAPAR